MSANCPVSIVPSTIGKWERSGSEVECLTRVRGARVRVSLASLRCVLEQDTLILA